VVAARLAIDPDTVGKWRRRFAERRLEGLWDEPQSGTPRTIEDARIEAVIVRTLETKPVYTDNLNAGVAVMKSAQDGA